MYVFHTFQFLNYCFHVPPFFSLNVCAFFQQNIFFHFIFDCSFLCQIILCRLSLSLSLSMWSFNSFFILKFFSMLQLSRLFQAKAFGNHQKRGKVSRTNLLELSGYSSTPLWNSLWEKIKTSKKVVLRRKKPVPRKFFPVV